jgi:2-hydroxy-3-keto-5-methylthiopentenyl-1-phosphate phosphatase
VQNLLVSDFDGTITRVDFYLLLVDKFIPASADDYLQKYRAGELSHFAAMAGYFSHAPEDEQTLETLLVQTDLDQTFAPTVRDLREQSWDLTIVSAGSSWYIERLLKSVGVQAVVHSSPGEIRKGAGLVLEPPKDSPFFLPEIGIDKAAVVRNALERYSHVAYAGDGSTDVAPSLLVRPEFRFARGTLAEELRRRNESFHEFSCWADIGRLLARQ